ncbi:MFS transporter [Streptomyces hydrogenans]|uniref:MFS transporter n=1 Tax=Streptomyces hydrogenans TaxID=1873719 RepID=UPI00362A1326
MGRSCCATHAVGAREKTSLDARSVSAPYARRQADVFRPAQAGSPMSAKPATRAIGAGASAALMTGTALGTLGATVMPVLLPGMVERFHLSNTSAGVVATLQLITTALATFAFTARATRPRRARIAVLGFIAGAVGFGLASAAPNLAVLAVANVVAGAGLGAVNAMTMASIAATDDTDRASSTSVLGATLIAAALVVALPEARSAWGGTAEFAVLAGCCIAALFFMRALPDAVAQDRALTTSPPIPVLFLLAVALFGASDQGAWSYSATLGEKHDGMSTDTVSLVLAIASLVSLVGVGISQLTTPRFGRVPVIMAFLIGEGLAKLMIATVPGWLSFTVSAVIWQVCFMGLLVSVLAVAACADSCGRWVAAAGGALAIGTALGPAPAGWVLDVWGAPAFGLAVALSTAISGILLLRTTRTTPATEGSLSTPGTGMPAC